MKTLSLTGIHAFPPLVYVRRFSSYSKQNRRDANAYTSYLQQMDASMLQKIAVVSAHILSEGNVADMGMGSGTGSYILACLYPKSKVTGIDNNPTMVELAKRNYRRNNLTFVTSDVAKKCLPNNSQEAIVNSSVLHHVTSFNDYRHKEAFNALEVQTKQLAENGVLIIRDFVSPGDELVWLDLPNNDGSGEDPLTCSTAKLFELFSKQFRSLSSSPGCNFETLPAPDGFCRYELTHKLATEFILRKDYREEWDLEIQEEYTYATAKEFETGCANLGLRRLSSTPVRNPWIIENRYKGKFLLQSKEGLPLDYPPTNYVIVGQKVPKGEGIAISEIRSLEPLKYLKMSHHQSIKSPKIFDLVKRPGVTLDVIPYYKLGENFYILARRSYPRPVVGCDGRGSQSIDGNKPAVYITEPLNVQQTDKPPAQCAEDLLKTFQGIEIHGMNEGVEYFPSPGGIQEKISSLLIQIDPVEIKSPLVNVSSFSTSGVLRAIDTQQILKAAQVGALPDTRLELNVYHLLMKHKVKIDPWIGEQIQLKDKKYLFKSTSFEEILNRPQRRDFRETTQSADFLKIRSSLFCETDADGKTVATQPREFVIPSNFSYNTLSIALLKKVNGEVFIGIEDSDLPAVQCFEGYSNHPVTPAWRLPKDINGIQKSRDWLSARMLEEYGIQARHIWELGGQYHPSPGVTPEIVIPLACDVSDMNGGIYKIDWVPLAELVEKQDSIHDGHLRVSALRAAHALGML